MLVAGTIEFTASNMCRQADEKLMSVFTVFTIFFVISISHAYITDLIYLKFSRPLSSKWAKNSRATLDLHSSNNLEYVNSFTKILSNLLPNARNNASASMSTGPIAFASINWSEKKLSKLPLAKLAKELDYSLQRREWFVTGLAEPKFFDTNFKFEDPDVKVTGLKAYCEGVRKIFDQNVSRAEIIAVKVNDTVPNTITVTWRLSGKVNLAFGLNIKPFIVYTDLTVSPVSGLIIFQRDSFSIPGYDILLSALLPSFVTENLPFLARPAPSASILRKINKQF